MISSEKQKVLKLLEDSLHEKKTLKFENDEWEKIYSELKQQCVYAVPYSVVNASNLDENKYFSYQDNVYHNIHIFYVIMKTQHEVMKLLESNGIKSVVLKGAAAAVNYPHPEYRCMGDIDLIVEPENFEKAFHCLCDAGYRTNESLENYVRHIKFHSKSGFIIELHNYFSTSNSEQQNKVLDTYIYNGIAKSERITLSGFDICILPVLENGLVLLAHINQHLGSGLGMRQIIDWSCFAEKYLDDKFWNESFSDAAEKIGMKRLAVIVTAMCQKYIGLRSDITWTSELSDHSVCDELMEYVIEHGNFGRKKAEYSKAVSVLRYAENPVKFLKEAQKTGCRTWKALEKHKWLKPFALFYQTLRWIKRGRKSGMNVVSVIEASKKENYETELLRKIGVTRL